VQIAVLGPLEVRDDAGGVVDVSGTRLRTLLARLALDPGRPVGVGTLIAAVWGVHPPAEETNALQTLVSRLRRALANPALIGQSPAGYQLALPADAVDAHRFAVLAADGSDALRSGRPDQAAPLLEDALVLWRGPALADVLDAQPSSGTDLAAHAARLEQLRIATLVDRVEADLQCGRSAAVTAELEQLTVSHPLHERLAAQLVRALAATGRQADALQAFERIRGRLADELGVDPGAELQQAHLAVLRGEVAPAPATERPPRRSNLKAQLTSFVGRDEEVARISKTLEQHRLVTLVGPGGAGKTRLAAESASRVVDTAPDGVWFVELAPVTSAADIAQAVLAALGAREVHLLERRPSLNTRDATSRLIDTLHDKQTIVLLDNCEHLIEGSARLADLLLSSCPSLRVLATSREPLGIVGETLLAVPPLGQPSPSASAAEALEYPAVQLFADRAVAVRPDFTIDADTVRPVVEIVRRLDGLPLAIELAAARLRTLPLADIAARLSDRFRLLTGGSRTALPRHRTLRAVVDWSWDLLGAQERRLAEELSVFPAGVTEESAEAVADVDAVELPDLLAGLIDKSLVQRIGDGTRMRMLETIREYGMDRLAERGELEAVRRRHAAYFARLVHEMVPLLITRDQLPAFARLAAERDNILAAMRYLRDSGDGEHALRTAIGLSTWAMMLGSDDEVGLWMAEVLDVEAADPQLLLVARALRGMGAVTMTTEARELDQVMTELRDTAYALVDLDVDYLPVAALLRAGLAFFADEFELAERFINEALDRDNRWTRASVRMFKANLAENVGDIDGMRRETDVALAEFRELGERWGLASTLRLRAQVHTLDGDLDAATRDMAEARRLAGEFQSREDEGFMLVRLADLALRRGELDEARAYVAQACERAEEHGSDIEAAFAGAMRAAVAYAIDDRDEARLLYQQAFARLDQLPREHPMQGHVRAVLLTTGGSLALADGDLPIARERLRHAYETALGTQDMPLLANVGVRVAELHDRLGDPAAGAVVLGASAQLRGADDRTSLEVIAATERLTERLGAACFTEQYERGKALDRPAAIERLTPPAAP
jgi:predicted ATPase/DNA-binding SARP family transcriptional activator